MEKNLDMEHNTDIDDVDEHADDAYEHVDDADDGYEHADDADEHISTLEGGPDDSTINESEVSSVNPNYHLLHNGSWRKKEYKIGRPVKYTGIWTCCGHTARHSLYCPSLEAREAFAKELEDLEIQKRKAEEYAKFVAETRRGPWERRENAEFSSLEKEDLEEKTLRETDSADSAYNVLMLVSWVYKNIADEPTAAKGMKLLHAHSLSGEGCIQVYRHNGVRLAIEAQNRHRNNFDIQLCALAILRQLLDCNFTRDALIKDTTVLNVVFAMGHRHMSNVEMVEHCTAGVLQASRSEECRVEILERRMLSYFMLYCRKYSKNVNILRCVLKLFNWVSSTNSRVVHLYELGAAKVILKCMERHMNNSLILAPAMLFLTRVSSIHSPALDYLVRKKAVPLVIGALRALYSEEIIQLEALKMLQALSRSPEGWQQISDTKGGWQSICQGTTQGNALIHDLKGSLHNPGWCIGETPHLPMLERNKLAAAKAAAAKGTEAKVSWTAHSLRQFMGISMKHQRLQINIEEHNVKFDLLKSLDLLPLSGEDREDWFQRIKEYEQNNSILISEMVSTVMDMKRKEAKEEKLAQKAQATEEYIKPVYVMGTKISTKALEEADINVAATLSGVV